MTQGRKQFDGKPIDEVVRKLETAWKIGCSDHEAACYADIGYTALAVFLKRNPVISARRDALKETPVVKAREVLHGAIEKGAAELALKYLERKLRSEFALKVENEHSGKITTEISDIRKKITDIKTQKLADELIAETSNIDTSGVSET